MADWYSRAREADGRTDDEVAAEIRLRRDVATESAARAARSMGWAPCKWCGHIDTAHPYCCTGGDGHPFADERAARPDPEPLDRSRLADAIRSNWYEIRPSGSRWVAPATAANAIADAYEKGV